jgi:hypothetical protein
MRTYTVRPEAGVPGWDRVEKAELDHALWLARPEGLSAFGQVCYGPDKLKVRLTAYEKEPLARSEGLTDWIHLDSALEFFFCPLRDDPRYFNFEFNPLGAVYLGFGFDRHRSVRQLIPDYRRLFSAAPFNFDGGWGIEFAIPASFIRIYMPSFKLETGLEMRGNFYKCGDETKTPHYLAWNPIDCDHPEFHRPGDFGRLCLE